jgi:hypothetical protein
MAITRMAEKLPNLIELSGVSGHKSLAMLKQYYHLNPEVWLKIGIKTYKNKFILLFVNQ